MNQMPRIEINLDKIKHNAKVLKHLCEQKGIQITGVVKGVCSNLEIVDVFIEAGITNLGVSKVDHLEKIRKAKKDTTLTLLRSPGMSEVEKVIRYGNITLTSELSVIRALSNEANKQNKIHQIIIMVEMGDLREGILPKDLPVFIQEVLTLKGINIVGIGTNFACFGGVLPTEQKMKEFSHIVRSIQNRFSLTLPYISGGNSSNLHWLFNTNDIGCINHLRLGESILLGRETARNNPIPNLYPDAFKFVAEVIEAKRKPSVPYGTRTTNTFGETIQFKEKGFMNHIIVGVGRQDLHVQGLTPMKPLKILGASSDHIILDGKNIRLKPGDEVVFALNYGAMLSAMTSPYIHKNYVYLEGNKNEISSNIYSIYKVEDEKIVQSQ